MKLEGTNSLPAPVETVWKTINDPEALRRCTPGLTELKEVGPDTCLLYTSPSPRDLSTSRMPSSA